VTGSAAANTSGIGNNRTGAGILKKGILGGTFDPIHRGHLMIASEAMNKLSLDEVLFIPASRSPFKEKNRISPVNHRVQMVLLAIADIPGFRLSTIEIDRAGTSYTVDTLEKLKEGTEKDDELYFIIGLDSLETLTRWKDPERLVQLCRLVTVRRPGYEVPELEEIEKKVPGLTKSLIMLDKPGPDISATDIRKRIAEGLPVSGLVPAPVEKYIKQHHLYSKAKKQ
jgi:nicotinate-nucleotide adenylyltransferase